MHDQAGKCDRRGRDFGAWLGLVPRQIWTGDRTILGRISKRGNGYLRTLFVQAARVVLLRPANWPRHSFGSWLAAAAKRMHHNVVATALANKLTLEEPALSPRELAVRFTDTQSAAEAHDCLSPSPFGVAIAGVGRNRAQDRIVGVALFPTAIERLTIER
jgi:hypothetical protein